MVALSKLQIRAKVLSVVSQIKMLQEYDEAKLKEFSAELEVIDERHTIFDILVKEYIKMNENEFVFTGCLIKELVDSEYIMNSVFDMLKSSNFSDESKYKLVQLLRITNCEFDYNVIPNYFENPTDVVDSDTKKLLEKAIFNPEAMLDFLDFVSAVAEKDRNILLQSLEFDYQGDQLANIVYPILYSKFDDDFKLKAIEILVNAKSSLAIAPLNYLVETADNNEVVNASKLGLKKLRFAGATEEKAQEYFKNIIKDTVPASFYTTLPDGNGNQAFIISRMNKITEKFMLSAVVTNDLYGIVDCFGFYNISKDELVRVIEKFYKSEGKYRIHPSYAKTRINDAFKTTVKNKNVLPYEFVCWDALIKDIEPFDTSIYSELKNEIGDISIEKDDVLNLLTKDYSFRWYIKPSENKVLDFIIDEICSLIDLKIDYINNLLIDNENNVFDEKTMDVWKDRILQCSYLLYTNDKKEDARSFFALLDDESNMHTFKMILLQRSVFNYFYAVKETAKESLFTTNIFRKKQIEKEKIDIKKIESILDFLSINWIHE